MGTSGASNHDAAPGLTLAIPSGEEPTGRALTTAETFCGPVCDHDNRAYPFVIDRSRRRADRATIVNRLLDWSDEARATGRVPRAEYLVWLAWDAYDRAPG